jgi:hypothetical protein
LAKAEACFIYFPRDKSHGNSNQSQKNDVQSHGNSNQSQKNDVQSHGYSNQSQKNEVQSHGYSYKTNTNSFLILNYRKELMRYYFLYRNKDDCHIVEPFKSILLLILTPILISLSGNDW